MFEKCDPALRTCKNDAQISAWLVRKFLFVLENQTRFQSEDYGTHEELHTGSLVRESRVKWVAIFSALSNRQELANRVKITDVSLQD